MSGDTFEALQVYATYGCWPSRWKIGVWNWDSELSFSSTIFLQKFRLINFFTKELSYTVNQFDEKILQWGKISEISTLCTQKNMNACHVA